MLDTVANGYVAVSQVPRGFAMHFGIARGQTNTFSNTAIYINSYIQRFEAKFS